MVLFFKMEKTLDNVILVILFVKKNRLDDHEWNVIDQD